MDLDAHIKTLLAFKRDVEKFLQPHVMERLIAFAESQPADQPDVVDLKKHVDELAEAVTGIQQTMEQLPATISGALDEALKPVQGQLAAVGKLADPSVVELLDWLAGHREEIDVLLTLGEPDEPEPMDMNGGKPGQPVTSPPGADTPPSDGNAQAGS